MRKIFTSFLLISCLHFLGQGITAYEDFRQNFVVFDNGIETTLETQPVAHYLVGGKCIPYIDNLGFFKIYYNGKVHEITFGPNIEFTVSDNLVTYFLNDQLWVFDNGKTKLLSIWVSTFQSSDHTIAFLDDNENQFCIYQNNKILQIEDVLTGINDIEYKVGENIVAYIYQNTFKANYGGVDFELSFGNDPTSFQVGRNIVAYTDENEQSFKAFYRGQIYTIEDFLPTWYAIGDNMVIYKDQLNNLKVFYNAETIEISSIDVTKIQIQDNVFTFMEQGQFKVFYNGELKTLEYNTPGKTILENNSVTYLDQTSSLKYYNGKTDKIITSERITDFYINIDVIKYTNSSGRNRVYHNGSIY